jgi:hypothetical protein
VTVAAESLQRENLQVLTHLASVAAVKIENALGREAGRRRRWSELAAREIQTQLRRQGPRRSLLPGCRKGSHAWPWRHYYDYLEKSDGRYAITIGDVAGRPLGGVAHATSGKSWQSRVDLPRRRWPAPCALSRRFPDRFRLFYGILDPAEHSLSYVARDTTPLCSRAGQLECLHATGRPWSFANDRHESARCGSSRDLICCSDGLPDSRSPAANGSVSAGQSPAGAGPSASEVVEARRVEKHRAAGSGDDLTLVVSGGSALPAGAPRPAIADRIQSAPSRPGRGPQLEERA